MQADCTSIFMSVSGRAEGHMSCTAAFTDVFLRTRSALGRIIQNTQHMDGFVFYVYDEGAIYSREMYIYIFFFFFLKNQDV